MSKKELDERKRKEEMEAAAHAFEEFIETFQLPNEKPKVWIKAGTYTANAKEKKDPDLEQSSIYKPMPRFKSNQDKVSIEAQECARILSDRKSDNKKRISNLELIKEELKLIHSFREDKQKIKDDFDLVEQIGDIKSTNLHVNNLNPKMTEQQLMYAFGKYGPLASVKIMWPRSDEEKNRNKNCGFVAFMSRKDAERALDYFNGKIIMDCELKVGWSKSVLLPTHPIYMPASLLKHSQPPPRSDLPFNAQPPTINSYPPKNFDAFLKKCVVRVVIPTDKNILALIHRMIEFVVQEGVLFEAMMMSRELHNPNFRFLFDNKSPEHIYYRWKLFSILQGESIKEWRTSEFRMYEGGSIWKPPTKYDYTLGMPETMYENEDRKRAKLKKSLSHTQRTNLEYIIHKLIPERNKISEALIFCMDHIDASEEIAECLAQSLQTSTACVRKIIARLYLISDMLFNTTIKKRNDSFKKEISKYLKIIMEHMSDVYEMLVNEQKQIFYIRMTRILNAWMHWGLFTPEKLQSLYKIFIKEVDIIIPNIKIEDDIDKVKEYSKPVEIMVENKIEKEIKVEKVPGFIPSRWETVDPDIIESQAMTTSKWNEFNKPDELVRDKDDQRSKFKNLSADKRKKLREIEVKVMEYQDELESNKGKRYGYDMIVKLVDEYRKKMVDQFLEKLVEEKKSSKDKKSKTESVKKSKHSSRKSKKYEE